MSTNIYITQKEIDLWNSFSEEILDKITGQRIYFLEIDKKTTKIDDLYGEAKDIVFKSPITVQALVNITQWENEMEHGQIRESPTIEVYLSKKKLDEIGFINAKSIIGNYLIFGNKMWEILTCVAKQLLWGEAEWVFGANMECKQIINLTTNQYNLIKSLSNE